MAQTKSGLTVENHARGWCVLHQKSGVLIQLEEKIGHLKVTITPPLPYKQGQGPMSTYVYK